MIRSTKEMIIVRSQVHGVHYDYSGPSGGKFILLNDNIIINNIYYRSNRPLIVIVIYLNIHYFSQTDKKLIKLKFLDCAFA